MDIFASNNGTLQHYIVIQQLLSGHDEIKLNIQFCVKITVIKNQYCLFIYKYVFYSLPINWVLDF